MRVGDRKEAQVDLLIRAHRVGLVFEALPFAMLVSVVLALFLAASLWQLIDRAVVLPWLAAVCLVNSARFLLAVVYRRLHPPAAQAGAWGRLALVGALLAGAVWGAGSHLLFIDDSVPHQVFLAFVIAGLCAGTVATMSAHVSSVVGFVLLASLPLLSRFAAATHEFATPMAVMLSLFILMLLPTSVRFYANLTDMLTERYARQRAQRRESARSAVLERVASGASLHEVLAEIALEAEREKPDSLASIMLLDEDGKHLRVAAAPSLPPACREALDSVAVVPDGGACAVAVLENRRVVSEDLSMTLDSRAASELVQPCGVAACWSEPVLAANGSVVGVLSLYHHLAQAPDPNEIEWIEGMARLTAIAIERGRAVESMRLAALVYQNSSEAMIVADSSGLILAVNTAFSEQTGWAGDTALGRSVEAFVIGCAEDQAIQSLRSGVLSEGRWQGEIECRRVDGSAFPAWVTIDSIGAEDGGVSRRVILLSDITEKKEADALIWSQANYDSLTGMPNRRLFSDRLHHAIRSARRDSQHVAALVIDLDRFKAVNETLGQRQGDLLLVEAARRVRACLRDADTVARMASDEFAVAFGELPSVSVVNRLCEQIINEFNRAFTLAGEEVFVTASIGIAVFPEDADEAEALLGHAYQAMNAAKTGGRNRFSFFTRSMQEAALNRAHLLRDLRQAIAERQFSLHYQPIVDLVDGSILKAEALLRWQHPLRGAVSPAHFIPLAEESGLIHEIGSWVFLEAAQQVKSWRSRHDRRLQISVNKSPVELLAASRDSSIDWAAQLAQIGLSGAGIAIEITEGVLVDPASNMNDTLLRLRDAGIQVSIDDFGTGYCSLAYLKRFDIDYLKIDKSFVSNLESDESDLALAEAIVVMAHKLGFKVIAEGVETEAQRGILCQIGCDYAQGYLFSRPLPAEDFEALLRAGGVKNGARLTTITGGRADSMPASAS